MGWTELLMTALGVVFIVGGIFVMNKYREEVRLPACLPACLPA
jgi:hypothetical protein